MTSDAVNPARRKFLTGATCAIGAAGAVGVLTPFVGSEIEGSQPAYIKGIDRAIRPDFLVIIGLCTHLGCAPKFRPEVGVTEFTDDWAGGFFCPCHGSTFDLSGRVFAGVPASKNLEVPPYTFEGENVLVIGVDEEVA